MFFNGVAGGMLEYTVFVTREVFLAGGSGSMKATERRLLALGVLPMDMIPLG